MASVGTVGLLKAVLTADTTNFDAGMKKAAAGPKLVEKSVSSLSQSVQKLTPQAERMVKSLGGDRLLYQANNLTAAVQKLGGAQKLTEANQARVNKTLTEAIAQYRLLGQVAPAAMVKIANETAKASQAGRASLNSLGQATAGPIGGFQQISAMLGPMARTITAAFTVGAVINFGRQIATFAGRMVDLSDETQISTSRLQAWDRVLSNAGLTVEDMVRAATELQKRLGSGDPGAAKAMRDLGLSASDLIRMKPDEAILKILEATTRLGTQAEKTSTSYELLGRVGPRMLRIASENLSQTIDEISKSSDVIRDDLILKADLFDDYIDNLTKSMKARIVNFLGWYQDQVSQTGLLPGGVDLPGGALGPLKTPTAPARPSLFNPSVIGPKAPVLPPDFAERVSKAKTEVTGLGKESEWTAEQLRLMSEQADQFESAERRVQLGRAALTQDMLRQGVTANGSGLLAPLATNDTSRLRNMVSTAETVTEDVNAQVEETFNLWGERFSNLRDDMVFGFSDSLAEMLTGLSGFKDGFLNIWGSIRRSFTNLLSDMLGTFINGFLRKMVAATAGQSIGQALLGGAAPAAVGALSGGGAAAAGIGAAGASAGIGGGAAAGTAAAGAGGLGATIAGLATNPFTIAAAGAIGGFLLWKKFGGSEESKEVNPRRDQFTGQFGGPQGLAAKLTGLGAGPGGGPLFSALQGARQLNAFQSAEDSIIRFFSAHKIRGIKKFNLGGFIPPGAVVPAMLHGGSMGEIIAPVEKLLQAGGARHIHNHYYTVQGWDGEDIDRVFRQQIIPRQKRALQLNQDDMLGHTKRVLG